MLTGKALFVAFVLAGAALAWPTAPGAAQASSGLEIIHNVEPATIAVRNGDDFPETARVNLSLLTPLGGEVPLDFVFVVDRSATTDIQEVQQIGEEFIRSLRPIDRMGLITFADEASLDVELTNSAFALRRGLDGLRNIGKTAIGDGLFAASQHLLDRGRHEAVWVEVLLTDGRNNAGRDPLLQAQRAADNGIQIIAVGMGSRQDENLLREVAQLGQGAYFREFSNAVLDEVWDRTDFSITAQDVTIVETLSPGIVYEQPTINPPDRVTRDPFTGTRLEWHLDGLEPGQRWTTSFTISATQEGFVTVNQAPSEVAYRDFRGSRTSEPLPTLRLAVLPPRPPNELPVAQFSFQPDSPSMNTDVEFASQSFDPDGEIESHSWEFGDGINSTLKDPRHRYAQDGIYEVILTVTDNRGESASTTKTLVVETKQVNVSRTINTFLPNDITLPGETFRVTLQIEINAELNGMGVVETINESIPNGWLITPINNAGARFKEANSPSNELQWVFLEVFNPGDTRTIEYEVTLPQEAIPNVFVFKGIASSVSPLLETTTEGESQVELRDKLPITLAVSRWDPLGGSGQMGALDVKMSNLISFDQVQVAVGWWLNDQMVPQTGGKRIDFASIQAIVAYWLTNTLVTDPLPGGRTATSS